MDKLVLKASERKTVKKSDLNELRKKGRVPGIFYSGHNDPIRIDVTDKSLKPLVYTSETHLVSLEIEGGGSYDCVVKDVQFDPITDKVIHFDLFGLTKDEKTEIEVPVRLLGTSVGVRDGGVLQHLLHKVNVECLPADIPTHIDIDISNLKIGDAIHVSDLKLENYTILNAEDAVVASVSHAKAEKAVEPGEEGAITEPEVISKGKSDDSEE
jgi:large subunit ribosomal protein L25